MKSLVLIVILVIAGIVGYDFVNKSADKVDAVAVVEDVATSVENEVAVVEEESVLEDAVPADASNENMTTPADMPEEARREMFSSMMAYNKCMMQNKPEYHQENIRTEDMAGKTLAACEPKLDTLKAVLEANNVNPDLREGMVKTVRQRSVRKLMSRIMQSQAAGMMPMTAAPAPVMPVTTP